MGEANKTYTGPNGGEQKLTVKARKNKQARDKKQAMSEEGKYNKKTAQVFRRNIKNIDMDNKDVHHSSDGSMKLVSRKANRGHHLT